MKIRPPAFMTIWINEFGKSFEIRVDALGRGSHHWIARCYVLSFIFENWVLHVYGGWGIDEGSIYPMHLIL